MERRRDNVLDWDSTFMGIAKLIAMRSKDPNTQVGAVIVAKDKRILSLGYNGLPAGMSDDENVWNREGDDELTLKYTYVCLLIWKKGGSASTPLKIVIACFPASLWDEWYRG